MSRNKFRVGDRVIIQKSTLPTVCKRAGTICGFYGNEIKILLDNPPSYGSVGDTFILNFYIAFPQDIQKLPRQNVI
jgi:hypothetical protein